MPERNMSISSWSESSHSAGSSSTVSPIAGGHNGGFPSPSLSDHTAVNSWNSCGSGTQSMDDNGFMDAVPFPYPPRRNVFIEPGSGMRDVPMWLKNLRLHKYTSLFQQLNYDDMMNLTEAQLEKQGVTKGARHKIVVCVLKLRERVELLKQLEKDLIEPGGVRTTLAELRQMITTPIRPYPPPGRPEPDQAKIDGVDLLAEDLDEENLPAHFTRVLGKLCMQMFAVANSDTEDDCFSTLMHVLDRCINHEAFTQAQKRRVISWKQVVKRVWNPAKVNRGSFGPAPTGSPPQRTGSWNKDRRGGNSGAKWHMGSPPRTPRKLNRSYSDTSAPPMPFMGNYSCPSQLMQNMNVQYAMACVIAAQQMASGQPGVATGHSFPFSASGATPYNEVPNVTSLPPVQKMQQMAAAAMLGLTGGHQATVGTPAANAGAGLLAPAQQIQNHQHQLSGNNTNGFTGLPGTIGQGHPTAPSHHGHHRTPTPPGGSVWPPATLQKTQSLPQQTSSHRALASPLEMFLNGNSTTEAFRNSSSLFGGQETTRQEAPPSPFHWFTSGQCRLEEKGTQTGLGASLAQQIAASASSSPWASLKSPAPERPRAESPTSPPNLMAFNFEHSSSSCMDINSRMEKLCRSVAEVAIGGLETPTEAPSVSGMY